MARCAARQASMRFDHHGKSDRDPFDDVSRHLAPPPVVDPRRPRVGMPRQVLHVLERDVLLEEVRHGRDAERVRREVAGQGTIRCQFIIIASLASDNSVSVHHYCFPCIKSVSWIHGKTSKTDRR